MRSSFYVAENGRLLPQQAATGSWNKAHQNGVAIGGALVREAERAPLAVPMTICRITIDIMRAVPFAPLTTKARVVREGQRLQVVEAELSAEGSVVAKATMLRARMDDSPARETTTLDYPMPEDVPARPVTSVLSAGHPMETRMVHGSSREPGPGSYWTRFNADLVSGESLSPFARAAMAADIASAPSCEFDKTAWTFANVDLSVYFTRAPEGEWIFIAAETQGGGLGTGLVSSILADRKGIVGRAHQTLFLAPRG